MGSFLAPKNVVTKCYHTFKSDCLEIGRSTKEEHFDNSLDHMKTEKHYIKDMSNEELHAAIDRVKNVKR